MSSYIFHRYGLAFEHRSKVVWAERDGSMHQFRNIVAPEELSVEVGIGTGQLERLAEMSVLIHVREEGAGEHPIVAAAAEDNPTPVARPGVIALGVRRVHLIQRPHLAGL